MKIKKEQLKHALEIVKPGLANVEMIEQSTSFAFIRGNVVTYNDEISLSHPVKDLDITGAVQASELYQFINKIKKDEIDIEINDNEILIKSGKSKAGLTLQKEIKLPIKDIGEITDWKDIPKDFSFKALVLAAKSCSNDMSRPVLTCVNMKQNGYIESSDGFRICRIHSEPLPIETFLLPSKTVSFINQLKPTRIAEGKGWVHFKTDVGTVLSCRIFEDEFPNIDALLDVKGKEIAFPKTINTMLEKAEIFAKRQVAIDESVYITLGKNKFTISGKSDTGWYKEETNLKYSGDDISFIIAPSLLMGVLDTMENCVINGKQIKFTGDKLEYLVMLKVDEKENKK